MNNNGKGPLLLTVKEVSQLLRIHRPKVYDLIREGTIVGFKLGSDWRVKRESIEALVGEIPEDFFKRNKSQDNEEKVEAKAQAKLRVA